METTSWNDASLEQTEVQKLKNLKDYSRMQVCVSIIRENKIILVHKNYAIKRSFLKYPFGILICFL